MIIGLSEKMWRYKKKRLNVLLLQCVVVIKFINAAPMLNTYDIWGDFKNKEYDNELLNENYFNSTSELEKYQKYPRGV